MTETLQKRASSEGPLPFSDFMAAALYDPDHGYYSAAESVRTGRSGDFFTNVSVGPLFGQLIAERAHQLWQHLNCPGSLTLVEPGAHDGTLASDILTAAARKSPDFSSALQYHLIESSSALRARHAMRLGG